MAFNVFYQLVRNQDMGNSQPWMCDKCHKEEEVLLKISVDYDTLILCKRCLFEGKKLITTQEKELKDENN